MVTTTPEAGTFALVDEQAVSDRPCTMSHSLDGGKTWADCDNPAEWSVLCTVCGYVAYVCSPCLLIERDQAWCGHCGHRCITCDHTLTSRLGGAS